MSDQLKPVVANALQNVSTTLNQFAGSQDFLEKIKASFGENFDAGQLENLRQQWLNNNFTSLPAIEILTGAELQGANAAYAGSTNTIYFSQDFLTQNADNLQAVSSVLLEEVGHYIDWQINQEDTPGDEGELFSVLLRGVNLSQDQVQQMKQENDFTILNLNHHLVGVEQSSSSNFNFETVFEKIVEDNGRSLTVFINGLWTTEPEYLDQAKKLSETLRLSSNEEIKIANETFSGSIQYLHYYNKSDKTGNLVVDIGLPIARGLSTGLLVFALGSLGSKKTPDNDVSEEAIEELSSVNWTNVTEALQYLQKISGLDPKGILENGLKGLIKGVSDLAILESKLIDEQKVFDEAKKVFDDLQNAVINAGEAIADALLGEFNNAQNNLDEAKVNLDDASSKFNNLFGDMVQQYGEAWKEYFDKYKDGGFLSEMIKVFAPVFDGLITGKNPIEDADFSKSVIDIIIKVVTDLPIFQTFTPIKVANAVYEGVIAALPEDFKEAFGQFWFSGTKISYENLNKDWIEFVKSELNKPNYSLTTIGYSQGNFFFEDALKDMEENVSSQNTRVFALGSPTNYLGVDGLENFNGEKDYNIKNENDPITKLQFEKDFLLINLRQYLMLG
jgi:hypothetical protein